MCGRVCVCPLQPQICSDTAGLTDDDKKKRRSLSFTLPQCTCTGAVQPLTLEMAIGYSLQDPIQLNVIPRILWHTVQWIYMIHCTINYVHISLAALTEQKRHFQPAKSHLRSQRKQMYSSVFPTFYFIFVANTVDLASVQKRPGLHKRFKVIWSTFIV